MKSTSGSKRPGSKRDENRQPAPSFNLPDKPGKVRMLGVEGGAGGAGAPGDSKPGAKPDAKSAAKPGKRRAAGAK